MCAIKNKYKVYIDQDIDYRLSEVFNKLDTSIPEGVTGPKLTQIFRNLELNVEFPDEVSVVDYLEILSSHNINSEIVSKLEDHIVNYNQNLKIYQEIINSEANKVKSEISPSKNDIKHKEDQEYLKIHRQILLKQRSLLVNKLKKYPESIRHQLKLQEIEKELKLVKA